jgi:hypothetical protein
MGSFDSRSPRVVNPSIATVTLKVGKSNEEVIRNYGLNNHTAALNNAIASLNKHG